MDSYKRPEHIELTADQSRDKTLLSMYRQIIDNPASRSLKSKPSQPGGRGVSIFFPHLGEIAIKLILRLLRRIIIFFT